MPKIPTGADKTLTSRSWRGRVLAGAALTIIATAPGGTPARAQSIESCNSGFGCVASDLLAPFRSLPDSEAGRQNLTKNQDIEKDIYLSSGRADKNLAAINSQLGSVEIIAYNVWHMADARAAEAFNAGDLLSPGPNDGPTSYYDLLDAFGYISGAFAGIAKDEYLAARVYYDAYGVLPQYVNKHGVPANMEPRPYETTKAIADTPWTPDDAATYAVAIQQLPDPGAPFSPQDWTGLETSPSFPSGHSTGGNTVGILSAIVAPKYFKQLVRAGVEFGLSRHVFGAHYPLDVMGGRILATFTVAELLDGASSKTVVTMSDGSKRTLNTPANPSSDPNITLADYVHGVSQDLGALLDDVGASPYAAVCAGDLAACLNGGAIPTADAFRAARDDYEHAITYGFSAVGDTTLDPVVPGSAYRLIETRFPYLDRDHLDEILATTQLASGGPLDDGSGWARLNLFAAADGFGAFDEDVSITMEAEEGGYNAFDVWGNDIAGAGGLILNGTGTLVLAGDNTYRGGTAIAGGTLGISGSIAGGVQVGEMGALVNAGTIATGAGRVENAGLMINDGRVVGDVLNTGTLTGSGTIRGEVSNAGLIAPGTGIGTMKVRGPVTYSTGSVHRAEIGAAGTGDLLKARGPVTIDGGALNLVAGPGQPLGYGTATLLSATGGITGRFDTVTDPYGTVYPFLDAALSYSADSLDVTTGRSDIPFTAVAVTANQMAVARTVDGMNQSSALPSALVSLNAETAPQVFDQLSGEVYASTASVLVEDSRFAREAVLSHLRGDGSVRTVPVYDAAPGPAFAGDAAQPSYVTWAQGFGSWGRFDRDDTLSGIDRSVRGMSFGADKALTDGARIGLMFGFSNSSVDMSGDASSTDVDTFSLGVYGAKGIGAFALRGGAAYGFHSVDASRVVALTGTTQSLSSGYDTRSTQVFGEVGYGIDLCRTRLEPYGGLAYVHLDGDAFSEEGGSAALSGSGQSQNTTFTTLGVRMDRAIRLGSTMAQLQGAAAWRHAFGDIDPVTSLAFLSGGPGMTITGQPVARDALTVGLGLGLTLSPRATIGISYGGDFADGFDDQGLSGRFTLRF